MDVAYVDTGGIGVDTDAEGAKRLQPADVRPTSLTGS